MKKRIDPPADDILGEPPVDHVKARTVGKGYHAFGIDAEDPLLRGIEKQAKPLLAFLHGVKGMKPSPLENIEHIDHLGELIAAPRHAPGKVERFDLLAKIHIDDVRGKPLEMPGDGKLEIEQNTPCKKKRFQAVGQQDDKSGPG